MTRPSVLRMCLCLAILALACAPAAKAQGIAGPCKDTWINASYQWAFHRAANGGVGANVITGECNAALYGGGSWSSYSDLQTKMANSKSCPDAWTGEAFYAVYGRQPSATECRASNFGNGQWSSYSDLVSKVQAYKVAQSAPPSRLAAPVAAASVASASVASASMILRAPTSADLISDAGGNLYDSSGRLVYGRGAYLIGENSSGIISQDGNGIISQDGNGLRAGDVIVGGAAGFHTVSLGKTVIKGTVRRK